MVIKLDNAALKSWLCLFLSLHPMNLGFLICQMVAVIPNGTVGWVRGSMLGTGGIRQ